MEWMSVLWTAPSSRRGSSGLSLCELFVTVFVPDGTRTSSGCAQAVNEVCYRQSVRPLTSHCAKARPRCAPG